MPSALKRPLSLPDVTFPSLEGSFRVEMSVGDDLSTARIWLESKQSKSQWECVVEAFKEHLPNEEAFVLSRSIVIAFLEHALLSLDQDKKKEVDIVGCNVWLRGSGRGHLEMGLTLTAFDSFKACYSFDLVPLSVEKAKIRDLEEALERKPTTCTPRYLEFTSTNCAYKNDLIVWDTIETSNAQYFELNRAENEITIRQAGLYHIQMTAQMQSWVVTAEVFTYWWTAFTLPKRASLTMDGDL
ncbi:unnamed protein product [Aphanomyces euteiches]|uniref:Uncharacterized protein n=1 Tax=Aphanomyces euteiches TaxID=100861 RepID=A0A6G0W7E4_9STRA|nr:hypothetical protein Ae201684_017941 [Aphanomyces euteiches]KAH9086941.1 hypothetical protein Ae201684P_000356 [Aphanomyces euteiches]